MNPLLPFLIMQGAYYATKHNREESRRNKHSDFDCDNDWDCENCWNTDCKYYLDNDPDDYDDEDDEDEY